MIPVISDKINVRPILGEVMASLNRNVIGDRHQTKNIKTMGLAACQGLCITYHLHSKAFCK